MRRILTLLMIMVGPLIVPAHAVTPARFCESVGDAPKPSWSERFVRVAVLDQPLLATLEDIGSQASLNPSIGPSIKGKLRNQRIEGDILAIIEKLAEGNGLLWFSDGRSLQVSAPEEIVVKVLSAPGMNEAALCRTLQRFQVLGKGLELTVDERAGMARVSGPSEFVSLVEALLGSRQRGDEALTVIKFGTVSTP